MKRSPVSPLPSTILLVVLVALSVVGPLTGRAGAASPTSHGPVSPALHAQIHGQGWGRVLVELAMPTGVHVPEGVLSTAAAIGGQRAAITTAQRSVLTRLWGTDHRVVHQYETVPYLALEIGPSALAELEAAGFHVARVVEDRVSFPSLVQSGPLVQADQAWARGYDGTGTTIAIVDTGVNPTHLFLKNKVVDEGCFSSGPFSLCPHGQPQETGPGSGVECTLINACEHATGVAGVIAGAGTTGGVRFSGIAKGAKVASYNVFSGFDCDNANFEPCIGAFDSDIIAALERILTVRATHNIVAVNMSLGAGRFFTNCDDDPLKPVIDNLRSFGVATVIASGNNGFRDSITRPACISTAVSVGSTNKDDTVSFFSNTASFLSLFAPGNFIQSSWPAGVFIQLSGTSFSAPHVAGAWAVMRQAAPGASVTDVLTALQTSGVPIADTRVGGAVTKPRIRVAAALDRLVGAGTPIPTVTTLSPPSAPPGGPAFTLTVDGANFAAGAVVLWNGAARPTVFVSATRLTASIGAADIAAPGSPAVAVRNPDGLSSSAVAFWIGSCAVGQFLIEYFDNPTFTPPAVRTECTVRDGTFEPPSMINDYGTGGPPGLPADDFSIRWSGRFLFGDGPYTFSAKADDTLKMFLDGVVVLDANVPRTTVWSTRPVTPGAHDVKIEYVESTGAAFASFRWRGIPGADPLLFALTPSSASPGTPAFTLTADGLNFVPGSTLFWNGEARATTFVSPTRVTASIPASDVEFADTAYVVVRTPDLLITNAELFTVSGASITGLTPTRAPAGGTGFTLTVDGNGFVSGATVQWNGFDRPTTFVSATQLTASIAASDIASPGFARVRVRLPDGTVSNEVFFSIDSPPPTLTALTPSSATAAGASFTLTVDGSNFVAGATVLWSGSPRSTVFVSPTRLTAAIPAADIAVPGSVPVTVRNPDRGISNALTFTINPSGGMCPTGQFFAQYFSNINLTPPAARTACEPAVNYNYGAGGPVGVPTDNFSARWTGRFSFAGGTHRFTARADDGVRVFVDGVILIDGWKDQAATTYTATKTLTAGDHDVKVEYYEHGGQAVIQVSWAAAAPAPTLTTLSPATAPAGSAGFTLTVDGTNFVSGAAVLWNGAARPTTYVSATRLTASIAAANVASAGSVPVTVRNPDGQTSNAQTFTVASASTAPCTTGQFLAEYFSNLTLTTPATRTACEAAVNYNYGFGGPAGLPADNFSARWTGRFSFTAGTYTFTARADDGVRVFVDGVLLINGWRDQAATTYTATQALTAGDHEVKVEYYEHGGQAVIQVSWAVAGPPPPTITALTPTTVTAGSPGFTLTVDGTAFVSGATVQWNGAARPTTYVTATRLTAAIAASDVTAAGSVPVTVRNPDMQISNVQTFTIAPASTGPCTAGQFLAEYFSNLTLTAPATRTACEAAVNYNYGFGGPAGLPADNFSARWTGRFSFTARTYTFTARADDGVRVFIDGVLLINGWRDQAATTYTATQAVTAGDHDVKVEYYEHGGQAVIQVSWAAAGSAPTATALTPSTAAAGSAGFALTVDGTNFVSGATVLWNGAARPTTYVSATRLTASIAAANVASAGSVPVTVRDPDGQTSNAQTFTVTPASTAPCTAGQFLAEYFSNPTLTVPATRTACEAAVNYDYGTDGPAGLPVDNFSVRWTGRFSFTVGTYTFTARADDGVRVFVDGVLLINGWRDQAATTYTATQALTAGDHEVKVEYYEHGILAVIQVSWMRNP